MRIGRFLRAAHGTRRAARGLARDEAGVAAIEFGLVAPMIFFSFLAMIDVGFALRERIQLDHVLRSGAQAAMRDENVSAVLQTLKRTVCKASENYPNCADLSRITFPPPDRYWVCPTTEAISTTPPTCAVRPQSFYKLSAALTYEGIFLPDMDFAPEVLVEVQ